MTTPAQLQTAIRALSVRANENGNERLWELCARAGRTMRREDIRALQAYLRANPGAVAL